MGNERKQVEGTFYNLVSCHSKGGNFLIRKIYRKRFSIALNVLWNNLMKDRLQSFLNIQAFLLAYKHLPVKISAKLLSILETKWGKRLVLVLSVEGNFICRSRDKSMLPKSGVAGGNEKYFF